jgi:acetyltransferase-like isoleucine patch superfamily enzyme
MVIGYLIKIVTNFVRRQKEKRIHSKPGIRIAESATVLSTVIIDCDKSGMIKIGENCHINELCSIFAFRAAVEIGDGVLIGPGTVIHTLDHNFERIDVPIWKQGVNGKSVIIEDDVWIGAHCTILPGVRIGSHSIIGAHSLVNRDIPPYSVAYGVPCVVKKSRHSVK